MSIFSQLFCNFSLICLPVMSQFLSSSPNFYLILALPLANLFFSSIIFLPCERMGILSWHWCSVIQMHLCRFWTGQAPSGCIIMHSQTEVHLLDTPQRTVSTGAWSAMPWCFMPVKPYCTLLCQQTLSTPAWDAQNKDHHAFYLNNWHFQITQAWKKLQKYNAGWDIGHRIKTNYTGTVPSFSFSLKHQHN